MHNIEKPPKFLHFKFLHITSLKPKSGVVDGAAQILENKEYLINQPELFELVFEVFKIPFLPILLVLEGSSIFYVLMVSI